MLPFAEEATVPLAVESLKNNLNGQGLPKRGGWIH